MIVPTLQWQPSKTPPDRSVFVNISLALQTECPLVDWTAVFRRAYSYFDFVQLHWATFPQQASPRMVTEVQVTWVVPGMPKDAHGATHERSFLEQGDFKRYLSYVWVKKVTGNGQLPGSLVEPKIGDAIAHEVVHWFCGPRHVDWTKEGRPGIPGYTWLMADDPADGPKMLDNYSRKILLERLGPAR